MNEILIPKLTIKTTIIIGFIKGEVIRQAIQTLSGTLAFKKAFKSGIDEQEQNGVREPKNIAFRRV